jgi:hypothetical protein
MIKEVGKAIGKLVLQIALVVGSMHCFVWLFSRAFGVTAEWLESSNPLVLFLIAIFVSFGWIRAIKWAFPEPNNKEER